MVYKKVEGTMLYIKGVYRHLKMKKGLYRARDKKKGGSGGEAHQILKLRSRENFRTANGYSFLSSPSSNY